VHTCVFDSCYLQVYTEAHFQGHVGTDLVVIGEAKPVGFKVSKSSTLKDFKMSLAKQMVMHFSNVTHIPYLCTYIFPVFVRIVTIVLFTLLGYPMDHIRMWPLEKRNNNTTRPTPIEMADNFGKSVSISL